MLRLFLLRDKERLMQNGMLAFVCPQVVSELRKENCNRRIILHHDNASSHIAHRTKEFLEQENIELLDHPPYSPDLSPN
ncbi:hypothetical protein F3G62_31250, partial [Pseudomonas aeruginosa]